MSNIELENKLEITEMKGDLKLLNQKIHTIETNHLVHLQKDIDKINKVLWNSWCHGICTIYLVS